MSELFTIHPYNDNRAFITVNRDVTEDDIEIAAEWNTELLDRTETGVVDWLDAHETHGQRLHNAVPNSTKLLSASRRIGYGGNENQPGVFTGERKIELSVRGCRTAESKRNKKRQLINDLLFAVREEGGRDRLIWDICEQINKALQDVVARANADAEEVLRDNFVFVKNLNAEYVEKALDEDLRYKALHKAAQQEIAEVEAQLEILRGRREAALLQKKDAIRRAVWKRASEAYGEEINKRVNAILRDESPELESSAFGRRF
ncbi:MAG: hypothetical protein AMS21_01775 [Gemmatimonas sp. SG8_38_2]|nr:MAG: hypothetical protein AMS21_01775 [Gemmatimonas sp. SG8_38_2]